MKPQLWVRGALFAALCAGLWFIVGVDRAPMMPSPTEHILDEGVEFAERSLEEVVRKLDRFAVPDICTRPIAMPTSRIIASWDGRRSQLSLEDLKPQK